MAGVMVKVLDDFGRAIAEAEKHRTILRKRFGLTDRQIGMMTFARRKRRNVMSDYAAAVVAAKEKLENRWANIA
jgi:hypothetical protein